MSVIVHGTCRYADIIVVIDGSLFFVFLAVVLMSICIPTTSHSTTPGCFDFIIQGTLMNFVGYVSCSQKEYQGKIVTALVPLHTFPSPLVDSDFT